MTYISRCEHGTPMGLCQKCFPDVSEQPDWSKYHNSHPVKELTDEEIALIWANYGVPMTGMDFKKVVEAILRKAQEK